MTTPEPLTIPTVEELNGASPEAFATALAPLFEGAPGLLARLSASRPFADDDALMASAREVALSMSEEEQVELANAHPRIGADPQVMSELSRTEQMAGDEQAEDRAESEHEETPSHVEEELAVLNHAYEAIFGFRYVVFVAGRPRAEIVPLLEHALRNERPAELRRAVDDAVYVAADRLAHLRAAGVGPPQDAEEVEP
jgi:2-oxo-4-hydroxy-4-carboxy--5-ureidoimidazoline (OHCU) decarboxylase